MKDKKFQFNVSDLKLSVSQVERIIGYKEGEDSGLVTGLIGEVIEEASQICSVKAEFAIFQDVRFEDRGKMIFIGNIDFDIKGIVYQQLKKSESVALFLCTAGPEISRRISNSMNEGDLLKGYVYDIVGSEIVEAAADLMQSNLEGEALNEGNKITNRYSPGYCGWDVAGQHKMFRLLNGEYCGVRLTESALMNPVKSASGIIGIGKNVKFNPYTCEMCNMKGCTYKKFRSG